MIVIGCATPRTSSPVEGTPIAPPSSTPATSHASPTPDGQEPAAAAIAILADPGLTMRTVVSGTANFDPTVGFRVSGEFDVDGADVHFELDSTGVGPGIVDTGTIRVGTAVFTRRTKGVWRAAEPSAAGETMQTVLAGLVDGTVSGSVIVGGRNLHRIVLVDRTLPVGLFGFEMPGSGGATLVALVDDSGRPAQLRVEHGPPDARLLDLTFVVTSLGSPITIDKPETWSRYRSEANGFVIDHPDDWIRSNAQRGVRFTSQQQAFCDVSVSEKAGWTIETWGSSGVHAVEDEIGEKVASVDRWSSASESGWLATWRVSSGDSAGYYLYAAFVDGRGYGYDVKWYSPLPQALSDRERFESFLRTLDLLH